MTDPFQLASFQTGLVYSCSIDTGDCEGVRGDTSFYVGMDTSKFITDGIVNMATRNSDLFSRPFAEGRLFDQARKLNCCITSQSASLGCGFLLSTMQILKSFELQVNYFA